MSAPMLTIRNRHSAACGIPPAVSTEAADLYIGYFENRYGEPWIFTFDRATREASLHGGDTGWARAHPVRDGNGSSPGTARAPASGLGPASLGGVVVVELDRVTPDSRRHRSRSPA